MSKQDIEKVINAAIANSDYNLFNRKFKTIYKQVREPVSESNSIMSSTIDIILLYKQKRYQDVLEYVDKYINNLLLGTDGLYDVCISKIIRMYYLSRKYLGLNNDILFKLLTLNKEMDNEETVSVLTTCILDYFVSNNVYMKLGNNVVQSELGRYNFYNGIIELVEGSYNKALECFANIGQRKKQSATAKKYLIITKLLLSDFAIDIKYDKRIKKYFELVKIVSSGDMQNFISFLEVYKKDLIQENLYYIVLRLSRNITLEKIRCMGIVYSRVTYSDLCKNLNIETEDLDYILKKSINDGIIHGTVVDNVYYSQKNIRKHCSRMDFERVVQMHNMIKSKMEYPEIEPLCYEKATK